MIAAITTTTTLLVLVDSTLLVVLYTIFPGEVLGQHYWLGGPGAREVPGQHY